MCTTFSNDFQNIREMAFSSVIILCLFLAASSTEANNFIVGGKNGWTTTPSEDYKTWSGRLRFLINDTLSFKYSKETDSVVVVNKPDYDTCNAANPISKLDGGDSTFKFDRSGPFYFITSNKTNCDQGQKLAIVVLALRNTSPPTPSATSPAPSGQSPVPSPDSQTPGPSSSTDGSPAPNAPEPSKSFAPSVSPAGVVSVVLSVTVAAFITFT
ncbi:early nodulin-like protein 2 [Heracleum sosnowskyi]|uniref:Early nodulin-like protein 2 n=1 Tax=Heracleum sosnowskyi TaxID=360622 RepID=A0AAD8J3H7_9APIA|nr:early nodulin-like protein 2 [Heracleum sosnowskyi]